MRQHRCPQGLLLTVPRLLKSEDQGDKPKALRHVRFEEEGNWQADCCQERQGHQCFDLVASGFNLDGPVCVRIRRIINLGWSSDDDDAGLDDDDDDEFGEVAADEASNSVLDRYIRHLMDVRGTN